MKTASGDEAVDNEFAERFFAEKFHHLFFEDQGMPIFHVLSNLFDLAPYSFRLEIIFPEDTGKNQQVVFWFWLGKDGIARVELSVGNSKGVYAPPAGWIVLALKAVKGNCFIPEAGEPFCFESLSVYEEMLPAWTLC